MLIIYYPYGMDLLVKSFTAGPMGVQLGGAKKSYLPMFFVILYLAAKFFFVLNN